MLSETDEIISYFHKLSGSALACLLNFISKAQKAVDIDEFRFKMGEWKTLAKKLNTNSKIMLLHHRYQQELFLELIRTQEVRVYNYSYLNRVHIDGDHIYYLKQINPSIFASVIMIVSKMSLIYKHFYKKMQAQLSQNHINHKIKQILGLCNSKKRCVNNNKLKFIAIVKDQEDRIPLIIQMSKMLREAWNYEKEAKKAKKPQPQFSSKEISILCFQEQSQFDQYQNLPLLGQKQSDLISNK